MPDARSRYDTATIAPGTCAIRASMAARTESVGGAAGCRASAATTMNGSTAEYIIDVDILRATTMRVLSAGASRRRLSARRFATVSTLLTLPVLLSAQQGAQRPRR